MKFWPFPVMRNYGSSPGVDALFDRVLNDSEVEITNNDGYYTTLSCSFGTLTFWTANKYYAYANQGEFKAKNGKSFQWKDEMPSRWMVRKIRLQLATIVVGPLVFVP